MDITLGTNYSNKLFVFLTRSVFNLIQQEERGLSVSKLQKDVMLGDIKWVEVGMWPLCLDVTGIIRSSAFSS